MNVLALIGPGANHRALASRLHRIHPLAHVAIVTPPPPKRRQPIMPRLAARTVAWPLRRAWFAMLDHYESAATPGGAATSRHRDVNAASVAAMIARERPELVVVSGTNLLRAPLIAQIADFGRIMNLHTGISPYLKGGPNCTNWALALGRLELIGSTIMWLDRGIDTGDIIATEQAPLSGRERLDELHLRVMEHAHDLYARCYARAVAGQALPSVAQATIGTGLLRRSRDWTATEMLRALANFYLHYRPGTVGGGGLTLVSPELGAHAA
ncbi:formyltransferase family protein [Sphingomonas sp.]|uniref:formyltransferase family protein n=1 Tax=Sphingomonas sp. TaxID=28214 RepID=UPI0035C81205